MQKGFDKVVKSSLNRTKAFEKFNFYFKELNEYVSEALYELKRNSYVIEKSFDEKIDLSYLKDYAEQNENFSNELFNMQKDLYNIEKVYNRSDYFTKTASKFGDLISGLFPMFSTINSTYSLFRENILSLDEEKDLKREEVIKKFFDEKFNLEDYKEFIDNKINGFSDDFVEEFDTVANDNTENVVEELEETKDVFVSNNSVLSQILDVVKSIDSKIVSFNVKETIEDLILPFGYTEGAIDYIEENKIINEEVLKALEDVSISNEETNITLVSAVEEFKETVEETIEKQSEVVKEVIEETNTALKNVVDISKEKKVDENEEKKRASNFVKAVADSFKAVFISAIITFLPILTLIIYEGVKKAFDFVVSSIKKFVEKIGEFFENIPFLPKSKKTEGKASGGEVKKDDKYIVGEKGRELFIPDSDGNIIPIEDYSLKKDKLVKEEKVVVKEVIKENSSGANTVINNYYSDNSPSLEYLKYILLSGG